MDTIVCYTTYTTKAAFITFWVIRSNHNVPSVTVNQHTVTAKAAPYSLLWKV